MRRVVLSLIALLTIPCALPGQQAATATKHRVAVLDFNYATVMTASQAVFGTNVDIGKGISDMLIDKLVNDGTYRVIERNAIDKILNEQNFSNSNRADPTTAAKIGHVLGVDAVIVGDITQFGRDDQNRNLGGLAGNWHGGVLGGIGTHSAKAEVGITARLIDTSTGEILGSATGKGESKRSGTNLLAGGAGSGGYGGGAAGMNSSNFSETIIGEATSDAVTQLAQGLIGDSGKLPTYVPPAVVVSGLVADASTSDIIINVGSKAGLRVGDKLAVGRVVRVVKDPATGKPLRSIEDTVGTLTITSVDTDSAVGSFSGTGKPQTGDTVKSQ
ncbi:MAG TPA: CsgG/HfaB family protein [Acidobacteriaceae bacterium]